METCTPRSKRSPRRSREDGSEGDAGQGVWEWRREITLHGPHGTRARALRPGPLRFGDGPTRRTHGRHLARLRRRTNRCRFTCAIQSQAKRPRIRFKFRMFNTTKRAARRLLSAVPSGNGQGVRGRARAALVIVLIRNRERPAPGRRDARATRDVCTEARSGARPCGGESPRRGTDALSNFLTRYRTWLTYKRGWRVGGQA